MPANSCHVGLEMRVGRKWMSAVATVGDVIIDTRDPGTIRGELAGVFQKLVHHLQQWALQLGEAFSRMFF